MIDLLTRRMAMMAKGGVSPTPPAPILPEGYTQLEYIENATKAINTNITTNGSSWEIDAKMDIAPSSWKFLIASDDYEGHFFGIRDNGYFSVGFSTSYDLEPASTRNTYVVTFSQKGISVTCNGTTVSNANTRYNGTKVFILAEKVSSSSYLYKGKIYEVKCLTGGAFHGIPAQRDSDSHKGLYDIENDTFYDLS